ESKDLFNCLSCAVWRWFYPYVFLYYPFSAKAAAALAIPPNGGEPPLEIPRLSSDTMLTAVSAADAPAVDAFAASPWATYSVAYRVCGTI
ncbi:MAG: hypothetical protein IJ386_08555, partial [Clostridia bacterium]|nr:hypothetical protein [Clostridia bacterium]